MDKEAELLKIQNFVDYCHSDFTFRSSISVSGFVCSKISPQKPQNIKLHPNQHKNLKFFSFVLLLEAC